MLTAIDSDSTSPGVHTVFAFSSSTPGFLYFFYYINYISVWPYVISPFRKGISLGWFWVIAFLLTFLSWCRVLIKTQILFHRNSLDGSVPFPMSSANKYAYLTFTMNFRKRASSYTHLLAFLTFIVLHCHFLLECVYNLQLNINTMAMVLRKLT